MAGSTAEHVLRLVIFAGIMAYAVGLLLFILFIVSCAAAGVFLARRRLA